MPSTLPTNPPTGDRTERRKLDVTDVLVAWGFACVSLLVMFWIF